MYYCLSLWFGIKKVNLLQLHCFAWSSPLQFTPTCLTAKQINLSSLPSSGWRREYFCWELSLSCCVFCMLWPLQMHPWLRSVTGVRMGFYRTDFKYININKQREASISFKHLQINTWFWPLTLLTPNCQSAGTDLNEKTKKKKVAAWKENSGQHELHNWEQ